MAIPFKVSIRDYDKIKNDPIHYTLQMQYNQKEDVWEGDAPSQAAITQINAIIAGKHPDER